MRTPPVFTLLLMAGWLVPGSGAAARRVRVTPRDGMAASLTSCRLGARAQWHPERDVGGGLQGQIPARGGNALSAHHQRPLQSLSVARGRTAARSGTGW